MVDATKVSSIKIKTNHTGEKKYLIFDVVNNIETQCAIIFGKNGSGKSTLARALSVDTKSTKFFGVDKNYLGSDCSNVHVFNESYVIKNFRKYPKEKIRPVILLGNFEQRREKISELKDKISSSEEKIENVLEECVNRALGENSLIAGLSFDGITIREYVDAYVRYNASYADNPEKVAVGTWRFGELSEVDKAKSIIDLRANCNRDRYIWLTSICFDFARGNILNDLAENEGISNYSVDEIKEKVKYSYRRIDEIVESDLMGLADIIYKVGAIWCEAAYWLMLLIYKEDEPLFQKINEDIIAQEDCRILGIFEQNLEQFQDSLKKEQEELDKEQGKYSSEQVTKYINTLLSMVFGGRKIWLESDEDFGYIANNKYGVILPSRLSIGEQNILSLCYFFASLCEGENFDRLFTKNQIVILDDPVSSFDDSNKYGVTALLGYLCQSVLDKSSKTKLIIMTHDLSFALNMSKMIKAIDDSKLSCWELQKDSSDVLIKSKFEDIDRYADMLRIMYDFAVSSQKNAVVPAPNDVRRVWEAFLSFELGETSIAEMGAMKKLSESFSKDKQIERFIKIFIPQLFINSDSHSKSQIMNGNMYLTPTLVGKPYEDFVKNIVCCMHIIAPRHIAWRMKKYKGEGKSILKFVKELDNLLKDVLDSPKIVTAMDSLGEIERLHRMRHRGGRVPLNIRRQAAKR